MLVFLVWIRNY